MNYKTIIPLIILSILTTKSFANNSISIHGYGTVGATYQNEAETLYRNSLNTKKGSRGDLSFANDSSFGLQLDIPIGEKFSFVAQGIASEKNTNGKLLALSWLNAKYQFNDNFSIKVGKMRTSSFLYSDILDLSYSYDWVRLPDMYSIIPINNYTGIELHHNIDFSNFTFISTYLYGQSSSILYDNINGETLRGSLDVNKMYGLSLKVLYDDFTFRVAYSNLKLTLHSPYLENNLNQLNALNIPLITQAIDEYSVNNTSLKYFEVAAKYDFEKAYLLGEYIELNSHSFTSANRSWYLATGYNFENWSPFMIYSQTKSINQYKNIKTDESMNPSLIRAITTSNILLHSISEDLGNVNFRTYSLGLRYNLSENSIMKLQYDRQVEGQGSKLNLHFSNNTKVNLDIFSAAVSFIF